MTNENSGCESHRHRQDGNVVNEHVGGSKGRDAFSASSGRDKKLVGIENQHCSDRGKPCAKSQTGQAAQARAVASSAPRKKFRAAGAEETKVRAAGPGPASA